MSSPTGPNSGESSLVPSLHDKTPRQELARGDMGETGGEGYLLGQQGGSSGTQRTGKAPRELSPTEQQELRRKINNRERKRMQDLNVAMDALREVMVPYSSPAAQSHPHHGQPGAPPGRRISKISTLILARNYILLLGSSLQEMRRLLGEVSVGVGVGVGVNGPVPRLLLTGSWPFFTAPGQLLLASDALLTSAKCPLLPPPPEEPPLPPLQWTAAGGGPGAQLCTCGVCRIPRFAHNSPAPRFPK
ncbi:oligodendrocyte transcription factor 1 [Megalops cyprinoides]|uniref:oligodendrocyte transcription factor 1 n=1 Tax=Megalops cyprinoides TaxID=118141 RepID=UPI0018651003|nr:oligodendrocyte transcription factor 1 [Megalops cyprinoides]